MRPWTPLTPAEEAQFLDTALLNCPEILPDVLVRAYVTGRNPGATVKQEGVTECPVTPHKIMVELRGLEPLTPRLPALCSPN